MVSSSAVQQPDYQCCEPPACRIETSTSNGLIHLHISPLSHRYTDFGIVGRKRREQVLRPALKRFRVKCTARKLSPPVMEDVQQPWPSKLRWLQRGPMAVGLKSKFPSPRRAANQGR